MLNTFCRQGALEMILEYNVELRDDIREALEALQEMKRESHRGMFDGTDLSSWSSPDRSFKSVPIVIKDSTLDRILDLLCRKYDVPRSAWEGELIRNAHSLAGVVSDGVVFSPKVRENSVIFKNLETGDYGAGTIQRIISHSFPHPTSGALTAIYIEVLDMTPIKVEDDLFRRLGCGWLCSRQPGCYRLVPLTDVSCHFARTNLSIKDMLVTHVYPTPKVRNV